MSIDLNTYTFCVPRENILLSQDPVRSSEKYNIRYIKIEEKPGEICHVSGSSRNGWATYALNYLLSKFPSDALRFLVEDYYDQRTPTGHGMFEQISILDQKSHLENALSEMKTFFAWCLENLDDVAEVSGLYDYDEIVEIINKKGVSNSPRFELSIQGDDEGDNIDYLFAYLRSIAKVMEYSLQNNMAVVHEQQGGYGDMETEDD